MNGLLYWKWTAPDGGDYSLHKMRSGGVILVSTTSVEEAVTDEVQQVSTTSVEEAVTDEVQHERREAAPTTRMEADFTTDTLPEGTRISLPINLKIHSKNMLQQHRDTIITLDYLVDTSNRGGYTRDKEASLSAVNKRTGFIQQFPSLTAALTSLAPSPTKNHSNPYNVFFLESGEKLQDVRKFLFNQDGNKCSEVQPAHSLSADEDRMIEELYARHGPQWTLIAKHLTENGSRVRTAAKVRSHHLRKQGSTLQSEAHPYTAQEDRMIDELFAHFGPQWKGIAKHLTDNGPHARTAQMVCSRHKRKRDGKIAVGEGMRRDHAGTGVPCRPFTSPLATPSTVGSDRLAAQEQQVHALVPPPVALALPIHPLAQWQYHAQLQQQKPAQFSAPPMQFSAPPPAQFSAPPAQSSAPPAQSSAPPAQPSGLIAKVERIRECLLIEAGSPRDIIANANKQLALVPLGGLLAQVDAILALL